MFFKVRKTYLKKQQQQQQQEKPEPAEQRWRSSDTLW